MQGFEKYADKNIEKSITETTVLVRNKRNKEERERGNEDEGRRQVHTQSVGVS